MYDSFLLFFAFEKSLGEREQDDILLPFYDGKSYCVPEKYLSYKAEILNNRPLLVGFLLTFTN